MKIAAGIAKSRGLSFDFTCFVLGFIVSREGFNGEAPFEHLAPRALIDKPNSTYDSVDEYFDDQKLMTELTRLWESEEVVA